jgi:MFS family permease
MLTPWLALVFLIAVGLYMYADRHVITLQVDPIRSALGIKDFQVGLLQGLGSAIFAVVFSYPIAMLSDRFDKRWILAGCIALWSLGVLASGLATSFAGLFIGSAIVGAGEAGLIPLSYAVIPELFEGRSRTLANSMMVVVGRVGSGVIIAGTGLILHFADSAHLWLPAALRHLDPWRLTFFAIAAPAPILCVAALFAPLQSRAPRTRAALAAPGPTRQPVLRFFRTQYATFTPFYAGIALLIFGMSALGAFLPAVAMRTLGATAAQTGGLMGLATLASTLIAMTVLLIATRPLLQWLGPRYVIWLSVFASLIPAVTAPLYLLAKTPVQLFAILGFGYLFLSAGSMVYPTVLQELTPRSMRARLVSFSITLNIAGSAMAPIAVGALSDRLHGLPRGLLVATTSVAGLGLLASAALLAISARRYRATAEAARNVERDDDLGASAC